MRGNTFLLKGAADMEKRGGSKIILRLGGVDCGKGGIGEPFCAGGFCWGTVKKERGGGGGGTRPTFFFWQKKGKRSSLTKKNTG